MRSLMCMIVVLCSVSMSCGGAAAVATRIAIDCVNDGSPEITCWSRRWCSSCHKTRQTGMEWSARRSRQEGRSGGARSRERWTGISRALSQRGWQWIAMCSAISQRRATHASESKTTTTRHM